MDEETWKAILEESDKNKDGKVKIYSIFIYNFYTRYPEMNLSSF